MTIITNPRERSRFLRFAVVGMMGAVVDFGLANALVYWFAARLVVAGTISFIAAIISNFIWNRFWTYPDSRAKPLYRQFSQFAIVSAAGLAIRIPILHWLEALLINVLTRVRLPISISFLTPDFLAKNFTLATAVIVVMFWNFFINRYWTYNDV